ncbi:MULTISPECIES: hypothetical protein [Streptomyces]|uniref:hypothetical protein n=1 Tax=Streptomyces TaxID=1883 RepID=UPI000F787060|nr:MULTISPECIES: hypothetical protein [Streptomyces]MBT3076569.1 hypothetical protein [Streptomyces sp. COG21]MBT3078915.1 hypothetical protein [Streptomyces sp. COG20]MBT3087785.1 hypothetical protein [Streptomyces sp. CYG21]MBT3107218.1 hypothetical protein [Streptomyces sp. COG19]MBT3111802.1 hypothetical protein [Streptomyces sp. CYG20]
MGPDMMAIVEDVRILGALLILPAASVFKAWLRYRRAVVAERGCTARLRTALHDVGAEHRAEVISACASVEAVRDEGADGRV